jgi:uncharacterized protein YigE (DUF2233 family)
VTLLWVTAPVALRAEPCRSEVFEGASYVVCSFDLTKDDLRTYWLTDEGKPYRTFAALAMDLKAKGKSLQFAMNGGMYRDDFRPVGLYIENGRELTPANTATRTGAPSEIANFYKKPNGIFYVGDGEAGILETGKFLARKPKAKEQDELTQAARLRGSRRLMSLHPRKRRKSGHPRRSVNRAA